MTKTVQDMLAEARAAVPTITPQEAMKMASDPNVVFVDLRDGTEVQASGKVKEALHIPRGLLEFQADTSAPSHNKALDPEKTIITYCAAGGRAALGGKTLKDMGYKNVLNMGGFAGWKDGGGEIE
jgi:rhodanese-related sulfurtransferase